MLKALGLVVAGVVVGVPVGMCVGKGLVERLERLAIEEKRKVDKVIQLHANEMKSLFESLYGEVKADSEEARKEFLKEIKNVRDAGHRDGVL